MLEPSEDIKKDLELITSPTQQRTLSALIFSNSTQKTHKARNSEHRYCKANHAFDKIEINELNEDLKSGKLLQFNESNHLRTKSKHRRKSSIDENYQPYAKNTKIIIKHYRNISDTDSVIYKQTEEDAKSVQKTSFVKKSLPVLERTPCTVYCRYCEKEVHSVVDFYNNNFSSKFLSFINSVMACCQGPAWLNEMKVHRCPFCNLVLGKVGTSIGR